MKKNKIVSLDPSAVHVRLGMCAAAIAGTAAAVPTADAAIITFNTPIVVPNNFTGVYVDLATGATSTTGGFPSSDFNPYNAGSQMNFFWGSPQASEGGVASTTTGPYLSLALGTIVGPASVYSVAVAGTTGSPYLTTGIWTLGFQFFNEGTNATDYGYLTMQTTASSGFPATILSWSYDDTGAPITVVPEPSTAALLTISALAAGALGMREWRRKRAA